MTPDKLEQRARDAAAKIFRGSLLVTDPQSAQNDIRIVILAALREAVDAETADLVKHLEWAMDVINAWGGREQVATKDEYDEALAAIRARGRGEHP